MASVVPDLKSATVHGLDEVQIIAAMHSDQNDVVRPERRGIAGATVTRSPSLTLPRIE